MRGSYHQALKRFLLTKYAERAFTQESLARATGKEQTTIGQYLKPHGRAGTLDLDEADAALAHVGSSLAAFIADPGNVVVRRPPRSKVAADLAKILQALTKDEHLAIVRDVAKGVLERVRREEKQSAPPRVAGRARATRKTGGRP